MQTAKCLISAKKQKFRCKLCTKDKNGRQALRPACRSVCGKGDVLRSAFQNVRVAVLDGLGKMGGGNGFCAVQVGDGARHPQDAVVGACGKAHTGKGGFQKFFAGGVQRTGFGDGGGGHMGVAGDACAREAAQLDGACGVHPRLDHRRRFRRFPAAHRLEFHRGDADVEVDAVQQRAGDLFGVFFRVPVGAGAAAAGMSPPAAAAGIHRADQLEPGGHMQRAAGAGHGDLAVFQRLAHRFQHVPVELRQLVQKQNAVVGQRDLAGAQRRAAAGEGGSRGGVMGAAEGTPGQQGMFGVC